MAPLNETGIIPLLIILSASFALWALVITSQRPPLPPGPTPLPIIGNLLQIPPKEPWKKLMVWVKQYGPISSLRIGSRTVIVLSSRTVVRDLLENRAQLYSSRPRFTVLGEMYFKSTLSALLPAGKKWERAHRLQSTVLNPRAAASLQWIQPAATRHFLHGLLKGDDLSDHILMLTTNNTYPLLFGQDIGSVSAELAHERRDLTRHMLKLGNFQNAALDVFQFLEYVPGLSWPCESAGTRFFDSTLKKVDKKVRTALQNPVWNFTQGLYDRRPAEMTWEEFCMVILELEVSGNITTAAALGILAATAVLHPEELRKVQAEIDQEVGSDRIPTIADAERLPRVQAFIKESLRLHPVAPLSVPRAVTKEDEYMGYRIPKDALVLAFHHGLNRDEKAFPNPASFIPQRWIDNPNLPSPAMFGFGKRVCPGRPFVPSILFLGMACICWGFNLEGPREFSQQAMGNNMLLQQPQISNIRFSCRSAAHRATVEREWNSPNRELGPIMQNVKSSLGL